MSSSALVLATALSTQPGWDPGRITTSDVGPDVERLSSRGDGVYGRFDGGLDLGLEGGAEVSRGEASGAVRGSLHYFHTAGVYVGYANGLGGGAAPLASVLSIGVDVRPLFLPRWSEDFERGPSFLDLTVDSLSLGLGAFWSAQPDGALGDGRGLEGSLAIGFPLMARAQGLWLGARGAIRWADPTETAPRDSTPTVLITLGWHQILPSPFR